jgi:PAS domain S-box-containing protein
MPIEHILILITELGAAAGALGVLVTYIYKFWNWFKINKEKIERVAKILEYELTPNGGSSIKDSIQRIEQIVIAVEAKQRSFFQAQVQDGVFETDAVGNYNYVNSTWSMITGVQPNDAFGNGWSSAIHPDDRDEVFEDWQNTWKYEREFNMKFRFKTYNNIVSDVHVHAVPTRSTKTNKVIGFFGIVKVLHVYKDKTEEEKEVDLN